MMHKVDESKQADLWTWIVIGLLFSAVTVTLYGPFVWEHWERRVGAEMRRAGIEKRFAPRKLEIAVARFDEHGNK